MRPLETHQRIISWLGAHSLGDSAGFCETLPYYAFTFAICLMCLCALTSSFIFFGQNVTVNLEDSLYALFQIFAYLSAFDLIIVTPFLRRRFRAIFETLSEFHKLSNTFSDFKGMEIVYQNSNAF